MIAILKPLKNPYKHLLLCYAEQAGAAKAGPSLPRAGGIPPSSLQVDVTGALHLRLVPHLLFHRLLHTHHDPPVSRLLDCQERLGPPIGRTQETPH